MGFGWRIVHFSGLLSLHCVCRPLYSLTRTSDVQPLLLFGCCSLLRGVLLRSCHQHFATTTTTTHHPNHDHHPTRHPPPGKQSGAIGELMQLESRVLIPAYLFNKDDIRFKAALAGVGVFVFVCVFVCAGNCIATRVLNVKYCN